MNHTERLLYGLKIKQDRTNNFQPLCSSLYNPNTKVILKLVRNRRQIREAYQLYRVITTETKFSLSPLACKLKHKVAIRQQ
jgi:hypothetical protein